MVVGARVTEKRRKRTSTRPGPLFLRFAQSESWGWCRAGVAHLSHPLSLLRGSSRARREMSNDGFPGFRGCVVLGLLKKCGTGSASEQSGCKRVQLPRMIKNDQLLMCRLLPVAVPFAPSVLGRSLTLRCHEILCAFFFVTLGLSTTTLFSPISQFLAFLPHRRFHRAQTTAHGPACTRSTRTADAGCMLNNSIVAVLSRLVFSCIGMEYKSW